MFNLELHRLQQVLICFELFERGLNMAGRNHQMLSTLACLPCQCKHPNAHGEPALANKAAIMHRMYQVEVHVLRAETLLSHLLGCSRISKQLCWHFHPVARKFMSNILVCNTASFPVLFSKRLQ